MSEVRRRRRRRLLISAVRGLDYYCIFGEREFARRVRHPDKMPLFLRECARARSLLLTFPVRAFLQQFAERKGGKKPRNLSPEF